MNEENATIEQDVVEEAVADDVTEVVDEETDANTESSDTEEASEPESEGDEETAIEEACVCGGCRMTLKNIHFPFDDNRDEPRLVATIGSLVIEAENAEQAHALLKYVQDRM